MPEPDQFAAFIKEVESDGKGYCRHSANLVRFLAYSGCRISEARQVRWSDVNLERGFLIVHNAGLNGVTIDEVDLFMKMTNGGTAGRFELTRGVLNLGRIVFWGRRDRAIGGCRGQSRGYEGRHDSS